MKSVPTTLFRALKTPQGRHVCVDTEYLSATTKVVKTEAEYLLAASLGWCDSPQEAMAQLEREQDALSNDAAVRAFDDRHLSEAAKAEAEAVESSTLAHLPEIPAAPKRGRPKKAGA